MANATILVTVTPEPPAYHDIKDDQTRVYAVHLTFGGDETALAKLLNNRSWPFTAYQPDGKRAADITTTVITSQTLIKDSNERLAAWLGTVSTFGTSPTQVGGTVELDGTASATLPRPNVRDVLHGSITWDAPLPQDLGLTYLVKCDLGAGASWPTTLLILPINTPSLTAELQLDGVYSFENETVAGIDRIVLKTKPRPIEPLPNPLNTDGFLKHSFGPDDYRILEVIEAKGASLFWALPAFLTFVSETITEAERPKAILPEAKWCKEVADIGSKLAIDPLLMAIGAPSARAREGFLLGSLASMLTSMIDTELAATRQPIDTVSKAALVEDCIDAVRNKAQALCTAKPTNEFLNAVGVPSELIVSLTTPAQDGCKRLRAIRDGLNALMAHFQSELGLEVALRKVVEVAFDGSEIKVWPPGLTPHQQAQVSAAVQRTRTTYALALDNGINAAEAVRAEAGYRALAEVLGKPTTQPLQKALESCDPYTSRIGPSPLAPCLPLDSVPPTLKPHFEKAWKTAVAAFLPDPQDGRATPTTRRFQPDSVPQPLPISISAAPGATDLETFTERFNGIGVMIRSGDTTSLKSGAWAHANLAEFHPRPTATPAPVPASAASPATPSSNRDSPLAYDPAVSRVGIRTFLPVAVDGRREMFLRYHGFPLSSDAYRDTLRADNDAHGGPLPFYQCRDSYPTGFQKVPRLVYGKTYEWTAYAITKGGSLPRALQHGVPWTPKGDLAGLTPSPDVTDSLLYRRRTAVGATTIVDTPGQPPRIGIRYPEVYPLALDSPRLCVSSINTKGLRTQSFVDLFRNSDGSGQLGTNTDDTWHLRLDGLLLDTKATVEVVAELRGYDERGEFFVSTRKSVSSHDSFLEIALASPPARPAPPAGGGPDAADPPASRNLWLRLRLGANIEAASLAFNPPSITRSSTGPADTGKSDPFPCNPDTPPVLLVGASPCWTPAFQKVARPHVVLPRTTWLDWEHWCGNRSLGMYGSPREQDASKDDAYSIADRHLLRASVLRSLDDEINRLLDRLPDPSVSAVIAELTLIDVHVEKPHAAAPSTDPRPPVCAVIPYSDLTGDAFNKFKTLAGKSGLEYGDSLRETLTNIDEAFSVPIEVKALVTIKGKGPDLPSIVWGKNTLTISIPEGTVARLTIRPFVAWPKGGHPAFHPGIRQLLVGEATVAFGGGAETPGCLFEGASLAIEGLYDLPSATDTKKASDEHKAFLKDHIEITPIPRVRDYRVMFVPERLESGEAAVAEASDLTAATAKAAPGDFPDRWCLFSHVEMRTQRWRFSGRPIYGWIKPNDFRKATATGDQTTDITAPPPAPAIELDRPDKLDAIKEFEAELFFDRDDADGEFTRVRLTGGRDELLACPWELPSATYFRHAFNFVSRYAGAMQPGKGTPLWPPRQADWSHRVAMLADAPRLEVTRPQMRCIVPLTTSPDGADPVAAAPDVEQRVLAPTAPVACILEERPFAVGGLAERMLGEIVTGVGYGFDSGGKDKRVHPLDFGKETSRDGRIAAWGWTPPTGYVDQPSPAGSFIVETEGPVGLHFEEVTTSAPAWSNCQYLLRPRSLRDERPLPEESFLGVQIRRFLDPEWIFDAKKAQVGPAPVRWPLHVPCIARHKLTTRANSRGPLARVTLDESRGTSLIDFEKRGNDLVVFASRTLLGANYPDGSLPLCEIPLPPSGPAGDVALLHIPHGDGSFTISIAVVPADDDASDGRAKVPLIVGTARWTIAHLVATKAVDGSGAATTPAAPTPAAPAPASGSTDSTTAGATLEFPSIGGAEPVVHATAMSQPTYREWTRTAKNADFITAMTGTGDDRPIKVSGIRAKLTDDKEQQLEFRLSAGQDRDGSVPEAERTAIWLCGSLANSRMPLFVHRYLVGVFTAASTKGSRTYQSFAKASLLVGRRPRLPAATDNRIDSLTIHEMEVPARIVVGCKDLPANLVQFKVAAIDLKATGGLADDGEAIVYRLHVRFANSQACMSTTAATVQVMTPNRLMTVSVPAGVHAFDLMWTSSPPPPDKKDPDPGQPSVRFILWNCLERKPSPSEKCPTEPPDPKLLADPHSIQVCIASISPPTTTELWADVSLLHRRLKNPGPLKAEAFDEFTFDWLFSSRDAGDDRFPGSRTLATTLAARTEAQARFISSSQPIAINPS